MLDSFQTFETKSYAPRENISKFDVSMINSAVWQHTESICTTTNTKKNIVDTPPVTIVSKKIKYLRINMTK